MSKLEGVSVLLSLTGVFLAMFAAADTRPDLMAIAAILCGIAAYCKLKDSRNKKC